MNLKLDMKSISSASEDACFKDRDSGISPNVFCDNYNCGFTKDELSGIVSLYEKSYIIDLGILFLCLPLPQEE